MKEQQERGQEQQRNVPQQPPLHRMLLSSRPIAPLFFLATITLLLHPTSAFCAATTTMTLSTPAAATPASSSSPNCVVRCLEHQLAATRLAKEEHDDDNNNVGYKYSHSTNNISSPIKEQKETTGVVTIPTPLKDVRNLLFQLCALTGSLSTLFWQQMPLDHDLGDNTTSTIPTEVVDGMAQLLRKLLELSAALSIDLGAACLAKIVLNNRKYPVDLCKVRACIHSTIALLLGFFLYCYLCWLTSCTVCTMYSHNLILASQGKAGKYTQYSQATGITKTVGQSTATQAIHTSNPTSNNDDNNNNNDNTTTTTDWRRHFLDAPWTQIAAQTRQFAVQREWSQYHTPRNLLLALMGELGELAELFQWKGDDASNEFILTVTEHDKVGQELADVTIYLCRLADVCGVALAEETKKRTME